MVKGDDRPLVRVFTEDLFQPRGLDEVALVKELFPRYYIQPID